MKLRKTKPQAEPVPTDNPKPKSRKPRAIAKPRATEPVPQPLAAKAQQPGRRPRVPNEPAPQPAIKRSQIAPKRKAPRTSARTRKRAVEPVEPTAPAPELPAPIVQSAAAHEQPGISPTEQPKPPSRFIRQPRPVPVKIPAILLEPDHLPGDEPVLTGPGTRFMAKASLEPVAGTAPTELPESYGTQQIFLAPRDPYWLLASWDLDNAQRHRYNSQSASGALTVRLRRGEADGPIHLEVHVKADSRDWFIYAGAPDATFLGELGFHERNSGIWRRISVSKPITMPRDRVSAPAAVIAEAPKSAEPSRFISDPQQEPPRSPEPPSEPIVFALAQPPHAPSAPRWEASEQPSGEPSRNHFKTETSAPILKTAPAPVWTEKQASALEQLISLKQRKPQHGSLEIEEMLRRHIGRPERELAPSSLEWVRIEELLGLAQPGGPSSLEAPPAPGAPQKFWFKVNAELIIYGSTEPNAHVSIGGRPIRLREDGTFSYRFALPDGVYELPALAIANDFSEARGAQLRFSRDTQHVGQVGKHPQDAALKTPSPANV